MGIGDQGEQASREREWCVPVSTSVLQIVPKEILSAWLACEAFQRSNSHFWPDNRALAVLMGVGPKTSVRRLLGKLEDLGILERIQSEGNHRVMHLRRRTREPITPGEWSTLEYEAEVRCRERQSTYKEFG